MEGSLDQLNNVAAQLRPDPMSSEDGDTGSQPLASELARIMFDLGTKPYKVSIVTWRTLMTWWTSHFSDRREWVVICLCIQYPLFPHNSYPWECQQLSAWLFSSTSKWTSTSSWNGWGILCWRNHLITLLHSITSHLLGLCLIAWRWLSRMGWVDPQPHPITPGIDAHSRLARAWSKQFPWPENNPHCDMPGSIDLQSLTILSSFFKHENRVLICWVASVATSKLSPSVTYPCRTVW